MSLAKLCAKIATREELELLLVEQAEEADRLRAENGRLRDALQRIAIETSRRMAEGGEKEHYQDGNREAGNVARAAIKATK